MFPACHGELLDFRYLVKENRAVAQYKDHKTAKYGIFKQLYLIIWKVILSFTTEANLSHLTLFHLTGPTPYSAIVRHLKLAIKL